jgi:glycosyltransferase involved in cell wall biosynthesis
MYGHVREYSRRDLERLAMACKNNVENLYTVWQEQNVIPGYGNWVMELSLESNKTKPPVVFFCGRSGGEEWSPHQIDTKGLGGSETAAIRMAKQFSDNGHPTIVYGPSEGVYDGVIYRKYDKFNPSAPAAGSPAWLFISSRIPDVFDNPVNAAIKVLWVHDNTFKYPQPGGVIVDRLTPERAKRIDKIFVLSEWQREYMKEGYPFIPDDKWFITKNGILPENFIGLGATRKKPHSFIWASSLDRGLDRVLQKWPDIKKMWPDAELDIFYGLDVMRSIYGHVPSAQKFMSEIEESSQQEGVNWRGRVGQKELAQEFGKHQFWFYPTDFGETFCIVALEAQAAGCIPITTNVGALVDKVPEEYRTDWGKDGSPLVELLGKVDGKNKKLPKKYVTKALGYTWSEVFNQWSEFAEERTKELLKRAEEKNEHNVG